MGPKNHRNSPHGDVGWLGSMPIPGGLLPIIVECWDLHCGCHEAVKNYREAKRPFLRLELPQK